MVCHYRRNHSDKNLNIFIPRIKAEMDLDVVQNYITKIDGTRPNPKELLGQFDFPSEEAKDSFSSYGEKTGPLPEPCELLTPAHVRIPGKLRFGNKGKDSYRCSKKNKRFARAKYPTGGTNNYKGNSVRLAIVESAIFSWMSGGVFLQMSAPISVDYAKRFIGQRNPECQSLETDSQLFQGSLSLKSYGFMVLIMRAEYSEILCGASLLDETHILTAGHCVNYIQELLDFNETIEAWIAPRNLETFYGQRIPIEGIRGHEGFQPRPVLHNDIAVAKLETPVEFQGDIQTVCVGVGSYHKHSVTMIGFGNYDCYNSSNDLRVASGQAMDTKTCKEAGHRGALIDSQLCAKLLNGENEPAEQALGDSGGPLFLSDPYADAGIRDYTQVGIVSYNFIRNGSADSTGKPRDPCPNLKIPGTYTRLGAFTDFIKELAPNARFCY
ncbi:unnamed protein product [Allacma fusca]|uniref:Peptidase S1 domain-containing protein n=1 Tax=Allacma fusca TaxID=39272 RepID=A0A8J2L1M2_9HEXA|nr:unnamed protein product [Allacma fusca]